MDGLAEAVPRSPGQKYTDFGDQNQVHDQGEVILERISITYSANYGIVVASASGDGYIIPGSTDQLAPSPCRARPHRALRAINTQHQVPGVVIENNVIALRATGGIDLIVAATDHPASVGAVPFARIVNNTLYGSVGRQTVSASTSASTPARPS